MADYVAPRLRRALSRVDAGPEGSNRVVWTSLREVCVCEDPVYVYLTLQTPGTCHLRCWTPARSSSGGSPIRKCRVCNSSSHCSRLRVSQGYRDYNERR